MPAGATRDPSVLRNPPYPARRRRLARDRLRKQYGTRRPYRAADQAALLEAVDKVCARAVAAHAGHSFPVPGFDPEQPDPSQLPTVANYFARYGGLPQTTAALHQLTPPAGDATAWRELLNTADQMAANARHQIAAARARNVTTFVQTVHTANRLIASINTSGARFGFTSDSPCGQVFG